MRTYGYKHSTNGGKRATGHQRTELYATREATEWDVRIDVNELLTADVIVSNIKERLDELSYVLVSGVERPDTVVGAVLPPVFTTPTRSNEHHVHVCVVLCRPRKRGDVLQLLRGSRKLGDEYCAPRNTKFTYAGWVIHHGKPSFKLDGEPPIRFEFGTLPMDPFTEDAAKGIRGIMKKWGTPDMEARFKGYLDIQPTVDPKVEIESKITRKMNLIRKLEEEIFELRIQLE